MKLLLFCFLFSCILRAAGVTYTVQVTEGSVTRVVTLDSEAYIAGVLAGESSTLKSEEALKAMAVAARTYAARMKGRHAGEGFDFCSTTHCQRFKTGKVPERLSRSVKTTSGQMVWFEGKPAFAVYGRDCGGQTEDAKAVWPDMQAPYLRAHEDPYCLRHGAETWNWSAPLNQVASALRQAGLDCPEPLRRVTVARQTASMRAKTLELEGAEDSRPISASSFRFALGRTLGWNGMRSDRYEVKLRDGVLYVHGSGQGHGVGLCQKGADEMGNEALGYREILTFYYPGVSIGVNARGLAWTKLGGEQIAVLTTTPDRDRSVVPLAERLKANAGERLQLRPPDYLTIRVYPTVEVFRNATAEPGWVAARSSGSAIDLQPKDVLERRGILRSTLYHEILHVTIEAAAIPGLPVWFREGLVECLSEKTRPGDLSSAVGDEALRQRDDETTARNAYAAARRRVARLITTYGETTVTGWLRTGLPLELRNSIPSSAPTRSR